MTLHMIRLLSYIFLILLISCKPNASDTSVSELRVNSSALPKDDKILYDVLQTVVVKPDNAEYKSVAADDINRKIVNTALPPNEIIMLYHNISPDDLREGKQQLEINNTDLAHGWYEISLVHENMLDDALRSKKIYMLLRPSGDGFIVYSIREQYKCQQKRGSQDWSKNQCS